MGESLLQVLMRRDNLSRKEALELIQQARSAVLEDQEDPQDVLEEMFGLELDYAMDLF